MSEVFNITHDAGNLDEYDSTVTDGGDLSATVAAALEGSSYGLQCVIDDTNALYGQKDFTQITSTVYRFRFYVDPNGLTMGSSDSFTLSAAGQGASGRCWVYLGNGDGYTIKTRVQLDSGTAETGDYSISDAEHYVEIRVAYASSDVASDGTLTLYVDGVQQEQVTGLDIYDVSKPDNARLGPFTGLDAGTSGTLYLDEFIFRDDDTEIGSGSVTVTPSVLTTTWATKAPTIRGAATISPSVLDATWALQSPSVEIVTRITPSVLTTTWATKTPTIRGAATVSPSVLATTWATETPTIHGAAAVSPSALVVTWATKSPTIRGAVTVSPSALAVTWALLESLAGNELYLRQKTLGGIPAVTLTIGAHDLSAYVMGYFYEEIAQEIGGLAVWLDNRAGNFDDLATDWPDLTRGAAVDLRRGLVVDGSSVLEKLPYTWIDSLQYVHDAGAAMLLLSCVDWWGKLRGFRYATKAEWSSTNVKTIAASLLSEVGLTLESGSFGFDIDHEIDVGEDGDEALRDLMDKVEEFLYAGLEGEIRFKTLDSEETAGYDYDWSEGGGGNHPLLPGSECAESSAQYNRVTVNGSGSATGTAEDTTESGLVGTRQYTIEDESLTTNAQCLERAQGELSFWQARMVAGTLVARPHFTLRLYDVVSVAAPPWGGPALSAARVTGIMERYGWGDWEQELTIGDLPEQSLLYATGRPGRKKSSSGRKSSRSRRSSSSYSSYYARKNHTHDASTLCDEAIGEDQLADGSVTTDKLADDAVTAAKIASNAVDTAEIASGAVDTAELANDAVTQDKIANNAVGNAQMRDDAIDTAELVDDAVTQAKIANNAVGNAQMADNAVDTAELVDDAVTQAKIASGAVGTTEIADDAVTQAKIADSAVGTAQLADSAITSIKISDGTISSVDLASGIISTVKIVSGAVTEDKLASDAVTTVKIQDDAVTQAKLANASVGYAQLTQALKNLLGI